VRVTIIADASHCQQTKIGSYSFWAVSQRGKHSGLGTFKASVAGSTQAEMAAVVNALHCTLKLGIAIDGDEVLIQTDSQMAINCFTGNYRREKVGQKPEVLAFVKLRTDHGLKIEFRHVKGHSKTIDRRSAAQRLVDQAARKQMRMARKRAAAKAVA
jgi:ribonuclease HI